MKYESPIRQRCKAPNVSTFSLRGVSLVAASVLAIAGCEKEQLPEAETIVGPSLSVVSSAAPVYAMEDPNRIPGRYIVRFKPGAPSAGQLTAAIITKRGGKVIKVLNGLGGFWGELPDEAIEGVRRNPNVAYIEADVMMPLMGIGDTVQQSAIWQLDRIDERSLELDGTYEYSVTGAGVHIWIVDSGVDRLEPELAGRIDETLTFTHGGRDPFVPCNPHGTKVARFAAGTTSGVAKGAIIHVARVDETCTQGTSTAAAAAALEFIGDYSPRPAVANLSLGKECNFFIVLGCGPTVDDAGKYARDRGVTIVVAAGNADQDACDWAPAHVSEFITVGASLSNDARHGGTNWGSCIDLFAPGETGTSMAAPMVTGVAALQLQIYPLSTPSGVAWAIINKATSGELTGIGSGSPNLLLYSKQPTLFASIQGPSTMGPMMFCQWSAVVSGGQPSYQYEWRRDGQVVSTTTAYSVFGAFSEFELSLKITDGVGRTAFRNMLITIDQQNFEPMCNF